jgi:hypothetical protein
MRLVPYRKDDFWYVFDLHLDEIKFGPFESVRPLSSTRSGDSLLKCKSIQKRPEVSGYDYLLIRSVGFRDEILPFDRIQPLSSDDKIFIVQKHGHHGLMNDDCEFIIPLSEVVILETEKIISYRYDNSVVLRKGTKYGLFDFKNDQTIIPIEFDWLGDAMKGQDYVHIPLRRDGILSLINMNNFKYLTFDKADRIFPCNNWCVGLREENEIYLYDLFSEKKIPLSDIQEVLTSPNDFAIVRRLDKYECVQKDSTIRFSVFSPENDKSVIQTYVFDNIWVLSDRYFKPDKAYKISFYKGYKFLFEKRFEIRYGYLFPEVENDKIIIRKGSLKYLYNSVKKVYNFDGSETVLPQMSKDSRVIKEHRWHADQNNLFYDSKKVYSFQDQYASIEIDWRGKLGLVYAVVDVDPEFGITCDYIGYIDPSGACYWQDAPPKDSEQEVTTYEVYERIQESYCSDDLDALDYVGFLSQGNETIKFTEASNSPKEQNSSKELHPYSSHVDICVEVGKYVLIFQKMGFKHHWEVNRFISQNNRWDDFVNIRSMNDHGNGKVVRGILPEYFKVVCEVLAITGDKGDKLLSSTPY